MPYCPKCGAEVGSEAMFCPKCGTSLAAAQRPYRAEYAEKHEKREKEEKREKAEKEEKHEKGEVGTGVQLGIGLIITLVGFMLFMASMRMFPLREAWPYFVIVLGIAIILVAVLAARSASQRSPKP